MDILIALSLAVLNVLLMILILIVTLHIISISRSLEETNAMLRAAFSRMAEDDKKAKH